jgi:protoheme IX farnesyltransferase
MKRIVLFADLIKYKLSLAVTFSAVTGYFISGSGINNSIIALTAGIFLLTAGAAALNEFTEKDSDATMLRTMNRPIPCRKITPGQAFFISAVLIISGSLILLTTGVTPLFLGLIAIFLYNVVYTKLKKISLFSIIPGAVVGAIPPLIGFTSAGAVLPQKAIILFSSFMFLWQLPHFWLILMRYNDDYRRAGFKTFSKGFSEFSIRLLVFVWVVLTTLLLILFSAGELIFTGIINSLLIILNCFFILLFYSILFGKDKVRSVKTAFILINSFSLLVMILFILNSVIS